MARVEYIAWPIATALCGSIYHYVGDFSQSEAARDPMVRLEARLRLTGVSDVEPRYGRKSVDEEMRGLLGNWRFLSLCRRAGHGRCVLECDGKTWDMSKTMLARDVRDAAGREVARWQLGYIHGDAAKWQEEGSCARYPGFNLGLEVRNLNVRLEHRVGRGYYSDLRVFAATMFQYLSGIIWTKCRFTVVLDEKFIGTGATVGCLFNECEDMVFRECEFVVDVAKEEHDGEVEPFEWKWGVEKLLFGEQPEEWEENLLPDEKAHWGEDTLKPRDDADYGFDSLFGGRCAAIGFRDSRFLTFLAGSCRVNARANGNNNLQSSSAIGLSHCGSYDAIVRTSWRRYWRYRMSERWLGDVHGYRRRNGRQWGGLGIFCQSHASGNTDGERTGWLAAMAHSAGLQFCYILPRWMDVMTDAWAENAGSDDEGMLVASSAAFYGDDCRGRAKGLRGHCTAGSSGTQLYWLRGGTVWECVGFDGAWTGTERFDITNYAPFYY